MGFNPDDYVVSKSKSIPVILLLDTSSRISGEKISKLNKAVKTMIDEFKKAQIMKKFIKVAIITFGNNRVNLDTPLTEVDKINFNLLTTGGMTPMGTALRMAKDMIEDKTIIKGRDYRPTVVLVSDGQPNDEWRKPLDDFVNTGRTKKCDRLALAIGKDVDMNVLNMFIKGCENPVFFAEDAKDIVEKFKQISSYITNPIILDGKPRIDLSNINISNILDIEEADDYLDDFEF